MPETLWNQTAMGLHIRHAKSGKVMYRLRWSMLAMIPMAAWGLSAEPVGLTAIGSNGVVWAGEDGIYIDHATPDPRGGRAYRLTYTVPVARDVYWRFKTDFDNDFLVENRYIRFHRFVSRTGNKVVTETKYTNGPDVAFQWETTVFEGAFRLRFLLLNPEQCGQRFHYGYIELSEVQKGTRVTQVAYFDFWGASIWANYPWRAGMRDFLRYTARWEKETVMRLARHYKEIQNDP